MKRPRLMIAGTGSSCGKTWITCALMRALTLQGKKVCAFKCGPDFIDPMFHERVLGIPSRNLDLYFTGPEETKALFLAEQGGDVSVVEGVMGLYDGLGGVSSEASAYDLAVALSLPVFLVVNAHGKGRSLCAEIAGFLSMDTERRIKGVILNRISEGFYSAIKPVIEEVTGTKVFGYVPSREEWKLESRHLGLKLPEEKENLLEHVTLAARQLEKSVDLDAMLKLAEDEDANHGLETRDFAFLHPLPGRSPVRIGVARDEAFCFYYRDNLRLLENAGARLIPFSPLRDKSLPPDMDGMILGGGYPELWARELSENESMRQQIRDAVKSGLPSLAECGGFLYLHDWLKLENGETYPMVGALRGTGFYAGRLVRFGYAEFQEQKETWKIRGHEFHYFDSDNCGTDCTAVKPISGRSWKCMHVGQNSVWGFGHLYYPSYPEFPVWFTDRCREYHECGRQ